MDEDGQEIVAFLNMVDRVGVSELDQESLDRLVSLTVDGDENPDLLVQYGCDIIARLQKAAAAAKLAQEAGTVAVVVAHGVVLVASVAD